MISTDFLVIGSGLAGLSAAIKVAQEKPDFHVTIVTKSKEDESNTKYAQGGMAVVLDKDNDSYQKHIEDTLLAGDGLGNKKVVEVVVKEGADRLRELVEWGAKFDEDTSGNLKLAMEGGHTVHRIVHHKDITGFEILRALLAQVKKTPNITLLAHHFAIDLITEHQTESKNTYNTRCFGTYVLDEKSGEISVIKAKNTLLATGGTGQVYENTTNPLVATGDGIAMAYRANVKLKGLEFVQFHPTALYSPGENPSFLISEAVRGAGAYLKTMNGEPFMHKYDDRGELASRDIVAKAIDQELKISGDKHVYLDCRHIDKKEFIDHFPNIYIKCKSVGIDISSKMIPVVPAAHYQCGGIDVDLDAKTTIHNLYAAGECSHTGLHGANRLASNSLLEAVVYAHRCYKSVIENLKENTAPLNISVPEWDAHGVTNPREKILITHGLDELKSLMSDYVSIVRSDERLKRASKRLDVLYHENKELYNASKLSTQLCELRNLITVAYNIIEFSKKRKENRGGFYNIDLD